MKIYLPTKEGVHTKVIGRFFISPKLKQEHFDSINNMDMSWKCKEGSACDYLEWSKEKTSNYINELLDIVELFREEKYSIDGVVFWDGEEIQDMRRLMVKDGILTHDQDFLSEILCTY